MVSYLRKKIFYIILFLAITISTLVSLEIAGQIIHRIKKHTWRFLIDQYSYAELFMPHPYLVGTPRPGVKVYRKNLTVTHNSLGFRGSEVSLNKKAGIIRVVTLGGSSTYCVGVSDNETWPYLLEKKLGDGWEVLNLGVPGYNSVENLIQTALQLQELSPDIAVFYEGWNDIHCIHIKNLKSDYSDFHGPLQYHTLRLNALKIGDKSIIISLTRKLLEYIFTKNEPIKVTPTENAFSANPDHRSLYLYGRNLKSIITLCRQFNIVPIMVPQVLNYAVLKNDEHILNDWAPFLIAKDIESEMRFYNDKMQEVANREKVGFVKAVLDVNYSTSDFVDMGHFSYSGNDKFATILADFIKKHFQQRYLISRNFERNSDKR
jgi:lysophospholipase L1-like esterase